MFQRHTWVDGLQGGEHVKAGEVLRSCTVSPAEQFEQVFSVVCSDDLVKVLVRGVGLECRERVREFGNEIFGRMVGLGFLRVLCGGPVVFRLCRCVLGSVGFPGDGLRQFKDRRLERIHGEVDIDGIFAFLDRF